MIVMAWKCLAHEALIFFHLKIGNINSCPTSLKELGEINEIEFMRSPAKAVKHFIIQGTANIFIITIIVKVILNINNGF